MNIFIKYPKAEAHASASGLIFENFNCKLCSFRLRAPYFHNVIKLDPTIGKKGISYLFCEDAYLKGHIFSLISTNMTLSLFEHKNSVYRAVAHHGNKPGA